MLVNIQNIVKRIKQVKPTDGSRGAVLLTVVFVMIIVGLIGGAIYSLTYTSTFTQMNAQNATRAYFVAESGFRVVAAEYNHATEANKNSTLESLNNETLTLPGNSGQFDIRIYPYWFYANSAYTNGGASISVKVPGGIPIIDIENPTSGVVSIPGSGKLKLKGKTQRATINASSRVGDVITFGLGSPGFPYDIPMGEELFLVFTDNATLTQTISPNSTLILPATNMVAQFMPDKNGSIRIHNENNDKTDYTYREKIAITGPPASIGLTGVTHQDAANPSVFPITVGNTSEIYLGKALAAVATTTMGQGLFAGKKTVVAYSAVGLDGGFNIGKETISFEEDIEDFNDPSLPMNDPDPSGRKPIEVDETNKEINLGGGLNNGYGSIWYGGYSDTANCIDGNCNLGKGFRAYFEFVSNSLDSSPDSTDFGDGFTFSIISGVWDGAAYRNDKHDTGSGGEYLGYAGPGLSGNGLKPPKIALEIDTYPNPGAADICGSGNRRDDIPVANHIALDYWGEETPGSLDAVGDYMRVGSTTPADGSPEDWSSPQGTISFWFKRDTLNYGDGNSSGDRLWGQDANMETRFNSTGTTFNLDWGSGGNSEGAISAVHPFTGVGKWYFIAITWDDDADRLQVFWGDETTPPPLLAASAENIAWTGDMSPVGGLIIENLFLNSSGGDGLKNYAVDGNGSDLRYYNVELTAAQLQNVWLFGSESGLQSHFPLQSDFANAAASTPVASAIGSTDWSLETPSGFYCGSGVSSYDDNRHGSGGGTTQPMNSLNTDTSSGNDGYYPVVKGGDTYNWMEDGLRYGVRMELIRPTLASSDGNYDYQIKAWVECVDATCTDLTAVQKANFMDTRDTYSGSTPKIKRTIQNGNPLELALSVHEDFKSILFGFTQGTGGATQDITLKDMEMRFIKTYPVSDLSQW